MAAIDSQIKKPSAIVKYEQALNHGFSRKVVTVTLTPESELGDVLANTDDVWSLVTVATTTNELAVLIDPEIYAQKPTTGTAEVKATVIYQECIVGLQALNFGADIDTDAEVEAVLAQLASKGIKDRPLV